MRRCWLCLRSRIVRLCACLARFAAAALETAVGGAVAGAAAGAGAGAWAGASWADIAAESNNAEPSTTSVFFIVICPSDSVSRRVELQARCRCREKHNLG